MIPGGKESAGSPVRSSAPSSVRTTPLLAHNELHRSSSASYRTQTAAALALGAASNLPGRGNPPERPSANPAASTPELGNQPGDGTLAANPAGPGRSVSLGASLSLTVDGDDAQAGAHLAVPIAAGLRRGALDALRKQRFVHAYNNGNALCTR
ncbi:hypothetical protein T492DRAFT_849818 [Pavlovales sp. CCMP2436]|nr:hypothetical protein T492DRAFT_849818 [Pavlovales sp. CCMP2436]